MRMPLLAIAVLLSGSVNAMADDLPQPDAAQAKPATPNGPVKIIDAAPAATPPAAAGARVADRAIPPAPPRVGRRAKTAKVRDAGFLWTSTRVIKVSNRGFSALG